MSDDLKQVFAERVRSSSVADKPVHVYEFDVERYKGALDWLNPKHWADPQLYGKDRW